MRQRCVEPVNGGRKCDKSWRAKMRQCGGPALAGVPFLLALAVDTSRGFKLGAGEDRVGSGAVEPPCQVRMLTEPIAVAPDVHDVTVVDEAIDQGCRHDVVPEDLAPLLEA